MKNFDELNYYEMLELPVSASDFDIRQAYKDMRSVYSEDSTVTYSLFSSKEREQILENIEKAFSTLIDRKSRIEYDRLLQESGIIDESDLAKNHREKLSLTAGDEESLGYAAKIEERVKDTEVQEITNRILSKEVISGADIRELRETMGIELENVYRVTRVSSSVLKAIEEDDIDTLPSGIYVKYLLKLYAGFLRVDTVKIVEGYQKNIDEILKNRP